MVEFILGLLCGAGLATFFAVCFDHNRRYFEEVEKLKRRNH